MTIRVNIDGRIVPPEEAMVPVFDRGFLYGDSVYEVTRTAGGIPFALDEHLERLQRSAHGIGMPLRFTPAELQVELERTLRAARNPESYIRIVVTRGAGDIGLDPGLADRQRLVIIVKELKLPPPEAYTDGVMVAIVGIERVSRRAVDPAVKSGNYLNSVLAVAESRQRGAYEAIMLDRHGAITEGASSNIFAVIDGQVCTPPLGVGILEGITRQKTLELCQAGGLQVQERPLRPEELQGAGEAFLTSSVRGLVPIVRVDDKQVGSGRPGPITRRLMHAYVDLLARTGT
jgi:branched-chain amino acid aminotransferase